MAKDKVNKKIDSESPEEQALFTSLRVKEWNEFHGQVSIK